MQTVKILIRVSLHADSEDSDQALFACRLKILIRLSLDADSEDSDQALSACR